MIDTKAVLDPLPPPRPRLRVFYLFWQIFMHLMLPAALIFFLVRSRREPLYRKHFSHRFGLGPVGPKGSVWVFATSLGETRAVSPLVRMLLDRGHTVCLSHSSAAGLIEGRRIFDDPRVTHRYVPFDLFWATGLFLARLRPCIGLVVEGEFWPGHLMMANMMGVPMLHVNGNLNQRSLRRGRGIGRLRFDILTRFNGILTKSEGHAERYRSAGVSDDRVLVVGEIKFDQWVDPEQLAAGRRLKDDWAKDRPVFVIASSVLEEEEALLELIVRVLALDPSPRIVWAPRSPQRFARVAEALAERGLRVVRRSEALDSDLEGSLPADAEVLVGDSTGEMNVWYAMADLVFVGATLADKGGHNVSEPLALGKPVVVGPSVWGITFPAYEAEAAGALRILPDAPALAAEVERYLTGRTELDAFSARARQFAKAHVGATARTLEVVERLLAAHARES